MAKKGLAKYVSVTTGSIDANTTSYPYTDGGQNTYGEQDQYMTALSPNGEMIFRFSRQVGKTGPVSSIGTDRYHASYFAIHQSQSSISGGYHFGNGMDSDSVIFSSSWSSSRNDQYGDQNFGATWLSDTEVAIISGQPGGSYTMNTHNLSGADFPSFDSTGAHGVFFILSGSGTDWNVVFWSTGSSDYNPSDSNLYPIRMDQFDYVVPNNRYTTASSDLIFVSNKGRYQESNRVNQGVVFKKTGGTWAWHSNVFFDGQTSRQTNRVVQEANWLGDTQDVLGIRYSDNSGPHFRVMTGGGSGAQKYSTAGLASGISNAFHHFAWDPYSDRFLGNKFGILYVFNSGSDWIGDIVGDNANAHEREILLDRYTGSDMGPDLADSDPDGTQLRWKFTDDYTGILYATKNIRSHLCFVESGSLGWHGHGLNGNTAAQNGFYYEVQNSSYTGWDGGHDVFNTTDSDGRTQIIILADDRFDSWSWNTEHGGSGDVLFTGEGTSTSYSYVTGRNIIVDLNAYDATPDDFPELTSYKTDEATTYEASSSYTSGLDWTEVYASYDSATTSTNDNVSRGGSFSPSGDLLIVPTPYSNRPSDLTINYGFDVYASSSSGFAYSYTIDEGVHSAMATSIQWISETDFLTAYGGNKFPQRFVSSSSGWSQSALYENADVENGDYNARNNLRYANTIYLSPDKKAFVLYSNNTAAHTRNRTWASFVSNSAGSNGFKGYAYNNEAYHNFVYAGEDSATDRYKLVGAHYDDGTMNLGLINKTTGHDTGGGLWKGLADAHNIIGKTNGHDPGAFLFYHSGSDTLFYSGRESTSNGKQIIIEAKMNPHGVLLYDSGSTSSPGGRYVNEWLIPAVIKADEDENDYKRLAHVAAAAFPISSSVGLGRFDDADASHNYRDYADSGVMRVFEDPNNGNRFFVASQYDNGSNPFRLKVLERGSAGWKMTRIREWNYASATSTAGRTQNIRFDMSANGDLVVPATGSNTGFAIARLVAPPPADPDLASVVSSAITAADGGTVSAGGKTSAPRAKITIPANAIASDTTFTVDTSTSFTPGGQGLGVNGNEALSPIVRLTPHGTKFSKAVTVTFNLIGSAASSCPDNAQLWKRNKVDSSWYPVPANLYSCSGGTITLSTTQFSDYIVIGGQKVARTKLNNVQLARLENQNKVLPEAINITGSSEDYITTIGDTDAFLVQSGSGFTAPISASAMATYFASAVAATSIDVSEETGNADHRIIFISDTSGDAAGSTLLADDDSLLFNPSTNTLKVGALDVGDGNISNVGVLEADTIQSDADGTGLNVNFDGDTGTNKLTLKDGLADALSITDGSADFMVFNTTAETITVGKNSTFASTTIADLGTVTTADIDGGTMDGVTLGATNVIDVTAINLDGASALGSAAMAQVDLLLIDDGGAGTMKSVTFSNFEDSIFGNVSGDVTIAAGGAATMAAAQTNITSLLATDIKIGEDDETKIDFETADEIHFYAANAEQVFVADGVFGPQTDSDVDLGTTGARFKSAFIDAITVTDDVVVGGNLTVQGTTTTIDTTNLLVEDSLIEIARGDGGSRASNAGAGLYISGSVIGHDISLKAAADGGRLKVSGSTAGFDVQVGGDYAINGTSVLTATTLGSAVVNSSLTSVGTLASGQISSGFGNVDIGSSTLDAGATTLSSAKVSDLTDGRVVLAGTAGELEDSGNLTFDGTTLTATSYAGDGSGLTGVGAAVTGSANEDFALQIPFTSGSSTAGSFFIDSGSLSYNPSSNRLIVPQLSASSNVHVGALFISGSQVGATAAELNIMDGGTTAATVTLANSDGVVINDGGTMKQALVSDFSTYLAGDGLGVSSNVLVVNVDDSGIEIDSDTLRLKDDGVSAAKLNSDVAGTGLEQHTDGSIRIAAAAAGDGLSGGAGSALALDLNELSAASVNVAADSIAIVDADDNSSKKESIADLVGATAGAGLAATSGVLAVVNATNGGLSVAADDVKLDMNDLAAASVDVSADSIAIIDSDDSSATKKESIADLVSAMTGDGLETDSGQLKIVYVEDIATKYRSGSVLQNAQTASLSQEPLENSVQVYLNGMLLVASGSSREVSSSADGVAAIFDYYYTGSVGARKVQFVDAIDDDDVIQIKYIKK